MVRVRGLDHIVLVVHDVERSLAWYIEELGGIPDRVEEWRAGEVLFPSVRLDSSTIIDLLAGERTGCNVDHLCLTVEPVELDEVAGSGRFDVVGGPSLVYGAQGVGAGLYVRDPDGNVVELRHYGADVG
jgi:catechol 2,3-dioxygenase-like lactoylglutathione lyase family enzyme